MESIKINKEQMLLATCQIIQIKKQFINGDTETRMLLEALPRRIGFETRASQSNQGDQLGSIFRTGMHLMQMKL